MNRRHLLLLILLSGSSWLQAQTITLSSPAKFDTVFVNTTDSLAFWVRNSGSTSFTVTDINTTRPEFWVKDTSFTVPAHDSVRVFVYFKSNQNVTWKDVLVVLGTGGAIPLRWSGTAKLTDASYISTQGLWENALKTALTNLVTGHTQLSYNLARDKMFETINDYDLNDTIECVYIGRRIFAPTRTQAQAQNFNTEHTWPQSFFADTPMVSDLNHLFPTDAVPNSTRGNYPFGPVVSNITYNVGGSKLGHRANGATAFEPRDIHKGDVARALFYFMIRYGNLGGYMDAIQETDLRVWHKFDPVSAKETQRNNSVASFQGKRNVVIDHPEFVDRITSFYTTAAPTLFADIAVSATSINFGTIAAGDSVEWKLIVINNGRASLTLTGLTLQTPSSSFKIIDVPTTVPVDSFRQVRLRFTPTQSSQTFNNTFVIQSNDPDEGTRNVALTGSTSAGTTPPAQALLVSPANGATGTSVPTLFQWRVTSTATRYQFDLDASGSFSSPLVTDSLLTDTLKSVSGLSFGTTYFWRVRAGNGAGWGSYSTTRSFATWSIPGQAQVISPADGATNVPVPSPFLWQSTPAATRYRFDLSTSNGFGSFVVVDSSLTDTSRSVQGLSTNSTYYWRVRAGSGAGWGAYSGTRSFITWNTPAQVQLQSPPDQAHGIPSPVQFTWQPSPGAATYDFDLSTSPSFGTIVTSDSTLNDTTHAVAGLDTLTTYYWRVRGRNNAGWGPFAAGWQFRIASTFTVTAQMLAGWNIISLPVTPVDPATTSLFPTAVSAAYIYSNGYFRRDSLSSGPGYWLNMGPLQSVSVSGEPVLSDTVEVTAGWNLVGSISYSLPSASVTSSPPAIITSPFYEFNNGYYPVTVLLPLKGYWVNCSQPGQLFLQGGAEVTH